MLTLDSAEETFGLMASRACFRRYARHRFGTKKDASKGLL